MTDLLPITYDNIDALAASAFAKSRIAATAIREDVLHNLKPLKRTGPERLLDRIERRRIFDAEMLNEIDVFANLLARVIQEGTTVIECIDNDACNVSPGGWTERRRTRAADELGRALIVLYDLQETLYAWLRKFETRGSGTPASGRAGDFCCSPAGASVYPPGPTPHSFASGYGVCSRSGRTSRLSALSCPPPVGSSLQSGFTEPDIRASRSIFNAQMTATRTRLP